MEDIRKIHIASDHAGFLMKTELKKYLEEKYYEVIDHGAVEENLDDDYTDFVFPAAVAVAEDNGNSFGIVIGGSGQGEAIVANRVPGIRAMTFYGLKDDLNVENSNIVLARQHNDANILSIGARFVSIDEAKEAIDLFLETSFSNEERHVRRISKIDNLDQFMMGDDVNDDEDE